MDFEAQERGVLAGRKERFRRDGPALLWVEDRHIGGCADRQGACAGRQEIAEDSGGRNVALMALSESSEIDYLGVDHGNRKT